MYIHAYQIDNVLNVYRKSWSSKTKRQRMKHKGQDERWPGKTSHHKLPASTPWNKYRRKKGGGKEKHFNELA